MHHVVLGYRAVPFTVPTTRRDTYTTGIAPYKNFFANLSDVLRNSLQLFHFDLIHVGEFLVLAAHGPDK